MLSFDTTHVSNLNKKIKLKDSTFNGISCQIFWKENIGANIEG